MNLGPEGREIMGLGADTERTVHTGPFQDHRANASPSGT
jgi:hypothetical protein